METRVDHITSFETSLIWKFQQLWIPPSNFFSQKEWFYDMKEMWTGFPKMVWQLFFYNVPPTLIILWNVPEGKVIYNDKLLSLSSRFPSPVSATAWIPVLVLHVGAGLLPLAAVERGDGCQAQSKWTKWNPPYIIGSLSQAATTATNPPLLPLGRICADFRRLLREIKRGDQAVIVYLWSEMKYFPPTQAAHEELVHGRAVSHEDVIKVNGATLLPFLLLYRRYPLHSQGGYSWNRRVSSFSWCLLPIHFHWTGSWPFHSRSGF